MSRQVTVIEEQSDGDVESVSSGDSNRLNSIDSNLEDEIMNALSRPKETQVCLFSLLASLPASLLASLLASLPAYLSASQFLKLYSTVHFSAAG